MDNNLSQNITAAASTTTTSTTITIIITTTVTTITVEKIDPISAMKIITLQEDRL
jgi:hypothetical protein